MLLPEKKRYWKSITFLADLRIAVLLLLLIAIVSITGTVIEQDQALSFYKINYPEIQPILGFLNWKVITTLGFDHVYNTPWFTALIALFSTSLISCTFLRQLPTLKKARQWQFYSTKKRFKNIEISANLKNVDITRSSYKLLKKGFYLFQRKNYVYAYKGLIGRISPIAVHASIILVLSGALWGSISGFTDQELIPKSEIVHIQNPIKTGFLSSINQKYSSRINNFWINYSDLNIDQFYTDLSLLNQDGVEVKRKVIYVNETLSFNGVTFYQTDWDILGLRLKLNNNINSQYRLSLIGNKKTNHLWRTFVTTNSGEKKDFLIILNDLTGNVSIYNNRGQLIQQSKVGDLIELKDFQLQVLDILTATGLQIKSDPGITLVYIGFGLLILSTGSSYITYSRFWVLKEKEITFIGGSTNRASLAFQKDFTDIVKQLEKRKNNF